MAEELNKLRAALAAVRTVFDLRDMFWIGGLASAAYGISMVSVPAAWITVGIALFWLGTKG